MSDKAAINAARAVRLAADPYGHEAVTVTEMFECWVECLNNVLDIVAERDVSQHLRDRIRNEATEWGLEIDDATGAIVTGIPNDKR